MIDKKQFLRVVIKLMSLLGLGFIFYIFVAGFFAIDETRRETLTINIDDLQPGAMQVYSIASGKLLVLKRTEAMIAELEAASSDVYAFDAKQNLADDMHPVFRSITKELFVAYGFDPFYRCELEMTGKYLKSVCVDVVYDMAGRVYKGRYAQGNLIVPGHRIKATGEVVIEFE